MFSKLFITATVLFVVFYSVKGYHLTLENAEIEAIDENLIKLTLDVKKQGDDHYIDVTYDVLKDLGEDLFIQLHFQKKVDGEYKTLYKSDIVDRCHFDEHGDKHPELKEIFDDMSKHGNLFQKCPIMKGTYYMKDYKLEAKGEIANLLEPGEYLVHYIMMKEVGTAMDTLYSMKWYTKVV